VPAFLPPTQEPQPALSSDREGKAWFVFRSVTPNTRVQRKRQSRYPDCPMRLKTDGNEPKMPLPFPFQYFFTEIGAGAEHAATPRAKKQQDAKAKPRQLGNRNKLQVSCHIFRRTVLAD